MVDEREIDGVTPEGTDAAAEESAGEGDKGGQRIAREIAEGCDDGNADVGLARWSLPMVVVGLCNAPRKKETARAGISKVRMRNGRDEKGQALEAK